MTMPEPGAAKTKRHREELKGAAASGADSQFEGTGVLFLTRLQVAAAGENSTDQSKSAKGAQSKNLDDMLAAVLAEAADAFPVPQCETANRRKDNRRCDSTYRAGNGGSGLEDNILTVTGAGFIDKCYGDEQTFESGFCPLGNYQVASV
jgi:hypothetical protein